jgi:hypothetical protein
MLSYYAMIVVAPTLTGRLPMGSVGPAGIGSRVPVRNGCRIQFDLQVSRSMLYGA